MASDLMSPNKYSKSPSSSPMEISGVRRASAAYTLPDPVRTTVVSPSISRTTSCVRPASGTLSHEIKRTHKEARNSGDRAFMGRLGEGILIVGCARTLSRCRSGSKLFELSNAGAGA